MSVVDVTSRGNFGTKQQSLSYECAQYVNVQRDDVDVGACLNVHIVWMSYYLCQLVIFYRSINSNGTNHHLCMC